jgi:hypothetical protein
MFTADELFAAAYKISPYRAESACWEWNRLLGSEQASTLAVANGCSSDLETVAIDFTNRLIHR